MVLRLNCDHKNFVYCTIAGQIKPGDFLSMNIWKSIPNWEGFYEASDQGEIKSIKRIITFDFYSTQIERVIHERIMKPYICNSGYLEVKFRKEGLKFGFLVHRLIAKTFIPGFTDDMEVNHLDGNKLNNAVWNIAGCSASENMRHAFENGLHSGKGKTHYKCRKIRNTETGIEFNTLQEAADSIGMKRGTLHAMMGRNSNRSPFTYA